MSKRVITPGELAPGLFISVLESERMITQTSGWGHPTGEMCLDTRLMGMAMEVLAVELPMVAVRVLDRVGVHHVFQQYETLDVRELTLMELSESFVKARYPLAFMHGPAINHHHE